MIPPAWTFRRRRQFPRLHLWRVSAEHGRDLDHRGVRDDDGGAILLQVQGCLIPAVVPLTFLQKHDAPTGKCNKESELARLGNPPDGGAAAGRQTAALDAGKED